MKVNFLDAECSKTTMEVSYEIKESQSKTDCKEKAYINILKEVKIILIKHKETKSWQILQK